MSNLYIRGNYSIKSSTLQQVMQQGVRSDPNEVIFSFEGLVKPLQCEIYGNTFRMKDNIYGSTLLRVDLDGTPSQCGMCILHGWKDLGSQNDFDTFYKWIEEHIVMFGYSKIMVTLSLQPSTQTNLERNGFKIVDTFHNKRSKNDNIILTKDV